MIVVPLGGGESDKEWVRVRVRAKKFFGNGMNRAIFATRKKL